MFTTPEPQTIVKLLAEGNPVWYVAAVTKSHRHYVYSVGTQYGYPNRVSLKTAVRDMTAVPTAA